MADALPVWSVFQVDRAETTPMQEQIAAFFRRAIADGRLGPGARLPSTRSLAEQMTVARNTVSLAYERLAAEGYVEGRRGGGTRVAHDLPDLTPGLPATARATPAGTAAGAAPVRLAAAARIMLAERVGVAGGGSGAIPEPLQPGRPGLDAFPGRVWARLAGRFWRETPATDFGYGDPAGHPLLRQALARYLGAFRGLSLDPDAVIVTSGAQQAIDLVARALLDPGDQVVLEEPCYPGLRGPMAATGARLVPVTVDAEGLDVAAARHAAPAARLVTVTPTHHFPLGVTLSLARRRALVDWAGSGESGPGDPPGSGPWILEDDYDGEFRYGGRPVPPLKALDGAGRVLYVGTVSKALAPALRIGFIVAPAPLAEPLVRLRGHFDRQPALDAQVILARFLDDGHMAGHLRRMRTLYRDRRDALADALENALGERARVERPETGINLTLDLVAGPRDVAVAEAARGRGVSPAPLSGFFRGPAQRNGLLVGFASLPRARAGWAARMVREAIDAAGRHGGK